MATVTYDSISSSDFKVSFEQPSLLYCDNDSTRYIATWVYKDM